MKKFVIILFLYGFFWRPLDVQAAGLVAGHSGASQFSQIPSQYINGAEAQFRLAYQHTSHGSQIKTGMDVLKTLVPDPYDYTTTFFCDNCIPGAYDLGNPNFTAWEMATRNLLDNPSNNKNVVMWSWCGQLSTATEANVATYLALMSGLERDYPGVKFIYMTGHLEGTGVSGNLHRRNEQIRSYVNQNDKILYDFADIESYDPAGAYYLDKAADDDCSYDSDGNGTRDRNWADQWCAANSGSQLCANCGTCQHSRCLNCNLKARAFWWLMARLAGWNPGEVPVTPTPTSTPTRTATPTSTPTRIPSPTSSPTTSATPSPDYCAADLNNDGGVGSLDWRIFISAWGGNNPAAEIIADGKINSLDGAVILANWMRGGCPVSN